jgi:hypothetical protein
LRRLRLAGDVARNVFGEQPAFDVGRTADREVDENVQPLPGIEWLVGTGRDAEAQ